MQRIMELINDAKAYLKSCGVDQWQNGYPDQHSIENDIRKGTGYLCIADEKSSDMCVLILKANRLTKLSEEMA